jgi:hypothetical protein
MMGLLSGLRLDTLLKRLCKSLLKKRLGDLILGDLDLDQFDLQLSRGTLQLNDLALNVDFINRKVRSRLLSPLASWRFLRPPRFFPLVRERRCPLSLSRDRLGFDVSW